MERTMLSTKLFFFAFVLLLFGQQISAQGWSRLYFDDVASNEVDPVFQLTETSDSNFLLLFVFAESSTSQNEIKLRKLDRTGEIVWTRTLFDEQPEWIDAYAKAFVQTDNQTYLTAAFLPDPEQAGPGQILLYAFNNDGLTIWDSTLILDDDLSEFSINDIEMTMDGSFILTGKNEQLDRAWMAKLSSDFEVQWFEEINPSIVTSGEKIMEMANGDYLMVGHKGQFFQSGAGVVRLNANGEVVFLHNLGGGYAFDFVRTDDDGAIIPCGDRLIRIDSAGEVVWSNAAVLDDIRYLAEAPTGNEYLVLGFRYIAYPIFGYYTGWGYRFDDNGQIVWQKNVPPTMATVMLKASDGFYYAGGGNGGKVIGPPGNSWLVKMTEQLELYTSGVKGNLFIDTDLNCTLDDNEQGWANNFVIAESTTNNSNVQFTTTDSAGNYFLLLDTGSYEISYLSPSDYWEDCQASYPVEITAFYDTTVLNLPLQPLVDCSRLEIDISAPFIRRCFESNYTVQYCNTGTDTAFAAEAQIVLDPYYTLLNTSLAVSQQIGDTLFFDLGDVPFNYCDTFSIQVLVDCDSTELGQTHCVNASISPNEDCNPTDPQWDGSSIVVSAECTGDSLFFEIENVGADMTSPSNYIVTEDVIMFESGEVQLLAQEIYDIPIETTGATYHLEVEQSPGHPGNSFPRLTIEGCVPSGEPFNAGSAIWFAEDDENDWISIDCQSNIGSFDPNDKTGFPLGINSQIERNMPIEYLIRFQNTGTDTAFNVVIEDRLREGLDVLTFEPGASSHTYRWTLDDRHLRFYFDDILLPDSTTNEPASHGFVKFKVKQKPDLSSGFEIYNSAAIFFDFNEPIITNETLHRITDEYIIINVDELPDQDVLIKAFPNPMQTETTIRVEGANRGIMELALYNISGQLILQQSSLSGNFNLQRDQLSSGLYFFQITQAGKRLGSGKVVVK